MPTISIGIKWGNDDSGLRSAVRSAEGLRDTLKGTAAEAEGFKKKVINFAALATSINALQGAFSGLRGALASVTEGTKSFDAAMRAANTMAGKGAEGFGKLKDQVSELAKQIPLAREELANGLYQVISNGVPEDNWIDYLRASARSAVGGIADLGQVVGVTSTIIKNYGYDWADAQAIQDKIQLTAKNGVTSFEQLADALPRVSATASTLGVNINELLATFATLTGVSGNTAEVSTQIAAVFTALIKPTSEAGKMAEAMGIQFDAAAIKAAGSMQSFLHTLSQSVQAYASQTGMLEQEIYGKLFGSAKALRALTPLMGNLSDKFGENIEAMKGSAGTMDEAFGNMAATSQNKAQLAANAWATFKDKLAAVAGPIQGLLTKAMPFVQFASSIAILTTSMKALNAAFIAFANKTGISAIVTWIGSFIGTLKALTVTSNTAVGALARAALAVKALKMAFVGLAASTGIGLAIWAVVEVFQRLTSSTEEATQAVEKVDSVMDNYTRNTSANAGRLVGQYQQLRDEWGKLKTEGEKTQWISKNKSSFAELGLSVDGVTTAEDIFVKNTDSVVKALEARARASALQTMQNEAWTDYYTKMGSVGGPAYQSAKAGDKISASEIKNAGLGNSDYTAIRRQTGTVSVVDGYKLTASGIDKINTYRMREASKAHKAETATYKAELDKRLDYYKTETEKALGEMEIGKVTTGPAGGTTATTTGKGTSAIPAFNEQAATIKEIGDNLTILRQQEDNATAGALPAIRANIAAWEQKLNVLKAIKAARSAQDVRKVESAPTTQIGGFASIPEGGFQIGNPIPEGAESKVSSFAETLYSLQGAMSSIGQAAQGSFGSMVGWIGGAIGALAQLLTALQQVFPGLLAVGAAQAGVSAAQTPVIGWLAVGAAIAAAVAAFASIPKFAKGGIVSGPTIGLMGEYPGASSNPEVIAPLDKLTQIVGGHAGQVVVVGGEFRMRGGDIVLSLANQTRIANLSGRRSNIKI